MKISCAVVIIGLISFVKGESSYYEDSWKVPLSPDHKTAVTTYHSAQSRQDSLLAVVAGGLTNALGGNGAALVVGTISVGPALAVYIYTTQRLTGIDSTLGDHGSRVGTLEDNVSTLQTDVTTLKASSSSGSTATATVCAKLKELVDVETVVGAQTLTALDAAATAPGPVDATKIPDLATTQAAINAIQVKLDELVVVTGLTC